jgi:hypothetical protein
VGARRKSARSVGFIEPIECLAVPEILEGPLGRTKSSWMVTDAGRELWGQSYTSLAVATTSPGLQGRRIATLRFSRRDGSERHGEGYRWRCRLISASKQVEHYEMGIGAQLANSRRCLGAQVPTLLDQTQAEIKEGDKKLSLLSKQVDKATSRAK